MKQIVRAFLFLLLFAAASNTTMADEKANIVKQGTVRGRIIDVTKQTLPGASIYIEKLHTGVTSDVNGFYTFPNLDPGTYTVKVSYVGYSPVELKITIPAGRTFRERCGTERRSRTSGSSCRQRISGTAPRHQRPKEQLGNYQCSICRPGRQIPRLQYRRCFKAYLRYQRAVRPGRSPLRTSTRNKRRPASSVTVNGNRVPSAEGDTRNVQLDLIPADMIQTIEVNKVVTPDMDADAIGGSINLVTKNSPYKRSIAATAGTGYNWISEKAQLNLGFTYGDRFFNDKLGLMVSASYQNAPSGSYDTEFTWEQV